MSLELSRTAALLLMAMIAGSCGRSDPELGNCSAVRAQYGQVPGDEWTHYDLDTQYRIYLCNNQGVHPHKGGGEVLARGGAEMAHFLARKLEATTYDLTIYDIVQVFAAMQTMRTFDATSDPSLMALIERKISPLNRSEDRSIREYAERYLQTIRGGPGTPLP